MSETIATQGIQSEEIDAGGKLEIMGPNGHLEIRWGRSKAEVDHAEALFKDLLAKGYAAFKKKWLGRRGDQIQTFDSREGAYLFERDGVPPKELPVVSDKAKDECAGEVVHEPTREFDKKAETVVVPPYQGG